jgi:hypothetical protein
VRHDNSSTAGEVGLYAARHDFATGSAPLHRFVQLSYNDIHRKRDLADRAPIPPPKSQRVPDVVCLMPRILMLGGPDNTWDRRLGGVSGVEFTIAGAAGGRWRDLRLTVTPNSVEGFWGDQRVGAISAERIADTYRGDYGQMIAFRPASAAYLNHTPADHRPRGGLGLYLWRGSASFRNVRITPIP